jgi:GxxExxY protein
VDENVNRLVGDQCLKAVMALDTVHLARRLNYLKATDLHLRLLLNFGGPPLEINRVIIHSL